jgi:hypothetical protein
MQELDVSRDNLLGVLFKPKKPAFVVVRASLDIRKQYPYPNFVCNSATSASSSEIRASLSYRRSIIFKRYKVRPTDLGRRTRVHFRLSMSDCVHDSGAQAESSNPHVTRHRCFLLNIRLRLQSAKWQDSSYKENMGSHRSPLIRLYSVQCFNNTCTTS